MEEFACKCCTAPYDPRDAVDGFLKCKYCGCLMTFPRKEADPEALSYIRQGNHDLDTCEFDKAFVAFQKAAELDPNEPEAFFGMALASFKVQYLRDETTDPPHLQPICHDITESDKVFTADKNYQRAVRLGTAEQKKAYRQKASEIDAISDEFRALKEKGTDYDVFICVKVTEEDGKTHTRDLEYATDIYLHLMRRGYKPFFSEQEMKTRSGSDYEALILYALYTAECMLIVCSNEDYLRTKWVKNEYTRFMSMIADEQKERDSISFAFSGQPIEKLPGKSGKIQGINLAKPDAYANIETFVENHTEEHRLRVKQAREEEERRHREEEEERNRVYQEQSSRIANLEKMLQERQSMATESKTSSAGPMLTRAQQELETKDFSKADEYFTKALDIEPTNGDAWWGIFLTSMRATSEDELLKNLNKNTLSLIDSNKGLANARKYASIALSTRLNQFDMRIKDRLDEMIDAAETKCKQNQRKIDENKKKLGSNSDLVSKQNRLGSQIASLERQIRECDRESSTENAQLSKLRVKANKKLFGWKYLLLLLFPYIFAFYIFPILPIRAIARASARKKVKKIEQGLPMTRRAQLEADLEQAREQYDDLVANSRKEVEGAQTNNSRLEMEIKSLKSDISAYRDYITTH